MKNSILISSDHHANWEALEKLFEYAKENNLPFIINGDIIGDYNFEEVAESLNLKFPYEITTTELQKKLNKEEIQYLSFYQQYQQTRGNLDLLLQQIPDSQKDNAKKQFKTIIVQVESKEFQTKLNNINNNIIKEHSPIISEHKIKLRALYNIFIKEHAKILAKLIDKYKIKTYFLVGNHEPIYFPKLVKNYLNDKDLLVNLLETNEILIINNISVAGISNVSALMPFLHHIYEEEELIEIFPHQKDTTRPILMEFDKEIIEKNIKQLEKDKDYIRLIKNTKEKNNSNLDLFISHGQVGKGAWRDDKQANPMPTLYIAALLSSLAKITIDGHLHTSYEMKTSFGTPLIRAIGNKAYVITKNLDNKISYNQIEIDANYNHRNGHKFENINLEKNILEDIFQNEMSK